MPSEPGRRFLPPENATLAPTSPPTPPAPRGGHDHSDVHGHESGSSGRARPWGLLVALVGAVGICWLGVSGQLALYVHPRYTVFTVVMAVLGGLAALASFAVRAHSDGSARGWAALAAAAVLIGTLLIVPPSALSSDAAQQRSVNSGSTGADTPQLAGADPASFSLRDWAALISTPDAAASYAGQQVTLVGFITASEGSPDTFYLTRFVITCCTVDAQPVGVPVTVPAWAGSYRAGQWLEVAGRLKPADHAPHGEALVVEPSSIRVVPQPAQPYEY
ncbi:TIGR03943 family putative permease subunit [Propionicimonas sp.]|uniref:TIGR03943 family putative permease subunit n=1 Tax=Propionicimonas sp. TaxID=1955623 RepID=UPI0039E2C72F